MRDRAIYEATVQSEKYRQTDEHTDRRTGTQTDEQTDSERERESLRIKLNRGVECVQFVFPKRERERYVSFQAKPRLKIYVSIKSS